MINWITTAGFLTTATENVYFSTAIHASGTDTEYKIISGHLPEGLNFSSTGTISGTPGYVLDTKTSRFVVRAYNNTQVNDRTFSIDVQGPDDPQWTSYSVTATFTISTSTSTLTASNTVTIIGTLIQTTGTGYLKLGLNNAFYVVNNQWVEHQLDSIPQQAPLFTEITYTLVSGHLPPNLSLSKSGRIYGFYNDKFVTSDSDNYEYYVSQPKTYSFSVLASDGVSSVVKPFTVIGVHPDIFRTDNLLKFSQSILDISLLGADISYLQPPQFLNGTDLGVFRSNNNLDQPVTAYDPRPETGAVTYSIITGTTAYTSLPPGLELDPATGYLFGYLPYQPAYAIDYSLTVAATKHDNMSTSTIVVLNTFTMTVKGEVESAIEWVTEPNLGTIEPGIVSELAVVARQLNSEYTIKYSLTNGALPIGLTLARDGSICGAVDYTVTGTSTSTFTVLASDVYELSSVSREFNLTVTETTSTEYTEIYCRPFLPLDKRRDYQDFTGNTFTFDPALIYRYYDPNFGVQHNIKMVLEFGIEQAKLSEYMPALAQNFYKQRVYFGKIKTAVAKDSTGNIVYEVVYVDAVNDQAGAGIEIESNGVTYYPSNIENQRTRLQQLTLEDGSIIETNEYNEPVYMRTAQSGDYLPPYYMSVIPICYALPGQGARIASRIRLSGFDFKLLDFEVDRLILKKSKDSGSAKYLIFSNQSISNDY
jgi:Putative Ig domain